MTDREKAIVMAHTGLCMLTGDKFQIFHKYVEDLIGRPVFTHEIGFLGDTIKEKSKADFIALCKNESADNKAVNRIRAEIANHCKLQKENNCQYCSYCNNLMGVREILEVIDKYKTESEQK